MSRPKTVMNHGMPAAGSRACPALPPRIRSAARSLRERSNECCSGSHVASSRGSCAFHGCSSNCCGASAWPFGARLNDGGELPALARTELEPVADEAAVDVAQFREPDLRGRAARRRVDEDERTRVEARLDRIGKRLGIDRVAEREVVLLDGEDVGEVARDLDRELERHRFRGDVLDDDPVVHVVGDPPLPDDRDGVLLESIHERVAEIERGRVVLDRPGGEQQRLLAVHRQPEERKEARVLREEAARLLADVASLVADAERRALEDRQRHYWSRRMRPPLDWASALTTISSTFTCSGRVSAKRTQSATSSAVSGSTPL